MKKILSSISFILIILAIWYTHNSTTPNASISDQVEASAFSTERALRHVKNIAQEAHYLGSPNHTTVKNYLVQELNKLNLSPSIQEGFAISDAGTLSKPQNIVAKIEGTDSSKSLLLLSHYDSNPHSSLGASDAGSGVATILEGVSAYLNTGKKPKNDIIICFTDAEELGLNGADLFVSQHPWAKDIGLVLNFEARGSGGPSYMLMETNGKNGNMIKEFMNANPEYPVSNSLAYSIYKLLPNDTDLTIFREKGNIDGFNFAFIDDHFDYHTANDTWQNLDLNTLKHQGSYLMPLLDYFAKADLSNLKSNKDFLYFNAPVMGMVSYPFDWIYPSVGIGLLLFILLLIYAAKKKRIVAAEVGSGFLAFIISLGLSGALSYALWKLVLILYPGCNDILHGFPYNGYYLIAVAVLLAVAVFFKVYSLFDNTKETPSLMVAPLTFWLLICGAISVYLPGGAYLIIPVVLALVCFLIMINQKKPLPILMLLISLPAIFILTPFITSFPVALGLKILFASAVLTVLLAALLLPVVGYYEKKGWIGNLAFFAVLIFFGIAHLNADFTEERPKPNSLVYYYDQDQQKAYWATYDHKLDDYTKNYIDRLKNVADNFNTETITSKYNNSFTYVTPTDSKPISTARIEATYDTLIGDIRYMDICITPQRSLNRMDLYLAKSTNFKKLIANGVVPSDVITKQGKKYNAFTHRWNDRLLTYHLRPNESLELRLQLHKDSLANMVLYEASYDLLNNPLFTVAERKNYMMPKPFVVNDAVMTKKTIDLNTVPHIKDLISSNPENSVTDNE
ncbi:M28 family peptidase [Aquimarina brevivitae]|uniref:Vacuolar membrane protease n=1 Tax=Aquimarina brevivitae TaxID=323412 RepID=A0A4Q7PJI8_9FLAO|nr:M28 family peptidase [Aquimarina brevivitae]RZS99072.1 peptidase M28-like protein [Aquimarina brevivitae]